METGRRALTGASLTVSFRQKKSGGFHMKRSLLRRKMCVVSTLVQFFDTPHGDKVLSLMNQTYAYFWSFYHATFKNTRSNSIRNDAWNDAAW